VSDQLL
jgi:molecular chaperone GrpE